MKVTQSFEHPLLYEVDLDNRTHRFWDPGLHASSFTDYTNKLFSVSKLFYQSDKKLPYGWELTKLFFISKKLELRRINLYSLLKGTNFWHMIIHSIIVSIISLALSNNCATTVNIWTIAPVGVETLLPTGILARISSAWVWSTCHHRCTNIFHKCMICPQWSIASPLVLAYVV